MLIHYLKIAIRNLEKYKAQSITGIFGLAFALACFVPALYWMQYETSFDGFYPDADNIYRVYSLEKSSGRINKSASRAIQQTLQKEFPAIQASTVVMTGQENCRTDEKPHVRLNLLYSDSTFFRLFPQTVLYGETDNALLLLDNLVLTESAATRLFGSPEKAIGQKVQTMMNTLFPPYTVTAVIKDPSEHSNFSFEGIINHNMVKHFSEVPPVETQWNNFFLLDVYLKLAPHTSAKEMRQQMAGLPTRLGTNSNLELRMIPIQDIRHHLNSDAPFTLNFIGLFVASGILLLFTAIFNFLNLHLDFFRRRYREMHLRAIHGATGGQLIRQMLFESACSIVAALALAGLFVYLIRPAFADLLDIEMLPLPLFLLFATCGIAILLIILLAGVFTFWRLSHKAMQPQSARTAGQVSLRRIAVTLQLAVSVVFIVASLVVMKQMTFVGHKDLGFDKEGLIQLSGFSDVRGNVETALIQKLEAMPQVESWTDAMFEPTHHDYLNPYLRVTDIDWEGKAANAKPIFTLLPADHHFAKTFRLQNIAGSWWKEGQKNKVVLNEEAARILGFDNPVGQTIQMPSLGTSDQKEEFQITGVVKNIHTQSMRSRIEPMLFVSNTFFANILYLRVHPGEQAAAIRQITEMLPDIDPTLSDVRLTPIGNLYDRLNYSEEAGLKLFSVLAAVCLLISIFGIYAVATAATLRRRKEIAIRKVMGADFMTILRMFFREYLVQAIIAGLIALPVAYIGMEEWLQGYAYRTNIPWWLLAGTVAAVIATVLLTVWEQVLKAASSNPAEVIKTE